MKIINNLSNIGKFIIVIFGWIALSASTAGLITCFGYIFTDNSMVLVIIFFILLIPISAFWYKELKSWRKNK